MPKLRRSIDIASDKALRLTSRDVDRLLNPASAPEAKMSVTVKMAGIYAKNNFGPRETAIVEQIFRLLVKDTEITVRAMLAEQLKSSSELPRDIALTMARDVAEEVAIPMLRYSEVLTEEDLIVLVRETSHLSRHIAIGQRETVPQRVSEALLAGGEPKVAEVLAANKGSVLSEGALQLLLARFSGETGIMRSLAHRPNLPVKIAEKLVAHVSASLAASMRKKYKLTDQHIAKVEDSTRSAATISLIKDGHGEETVEQLVSQLVAFNRLTPSLVFSALAEGRMMFFEAALARMSGMPTASVRRLLEDHGELGLRAIYTKANLPKERFEEMQKFMAAKRSLRPVQPKGPAT